MAVRLHGSETGEGVKIAGRGGRRPGEGSQNSPRADGTEGMSQVEPPLFTIPRPGGRTEGQGSKIRGV